MAHFHPPATLLARYATGTLSPQASLLVATHIALCQDCCAEAKRFEQVGGDMLACCEEAKVSDDCRQKVMAALEAKAKDAPEAAEVPAAVCRMLPSPLRQQVGCGADDIRWSRQWAGVDILNLSGLKRTQLLRVAAGLAAPPHFHFRSEMTLVLAGSLSEGKTEYRRGDVIYHRAGSLHRPRAGFEQDCVCLIVQGT